MNNIKVKILRHNFDGTPLFLAKMTQRGSTIHSIEDLEELYKDNVNRVPSKELLKLPHSTISRMCEMTVGIYGLSTKAVSQLRTHATRLTFMSTSTQYSEFTKLDLPYVVPPNLKVEEKELYEHSLETIHQAYKELYSLTGDKDKASYMLPQSLKKCLIIHGNFPAWQYMLSLRLCNRNTEEVQYICQQILQEVNDQCGKNWADLCLPSCVTEKCHEGKFSCGHKYKDVRKEELDESLCQ